MFGKTLLNLFLILGIVKVFPSLALPLNGEVTRPLLGNSSSASQRARSTASETPPTQVQQMVRSGDEQNKGHSTGYQADLDKALAGEDTFCKTAATIGCMPCRDDFLLN
ncbi:hypothetical protein PGTUg99_003756 [Puccinia graminis f. sp. tritici]|uniref:Uncharacterized protein n=1 Tax=Puccinia graminis f. sp. tritici TaxID=56615 RepID=A0A5B0MQW4_PUCGR|nr:hypothetical protein PGTUg99_003756 [Puccinia graminis f. sp. tritici]